MSKIDFQQFSRVCVKCRQPFPISHFRRKRKTGIERAKDCRACHAAVVREWRHRKQEKQNRQQLNQFAAAINRAETDNEIRKLVTHILDQFGSVESLAASWSKLLKSATESPELRVAPLKSFEAIFRLISYCQEHPPNFDELDLDQIQEEKRRLLREEMLNNPTWVLHSARQLGWKINQPTSR